MPGVVGHASRRSPSLYAAVAAALLRRLAWLRRLLRFVDASLTKRAGQAMMCVAGRRMRR